MPLIYKQLSIFTNLFLLFLCMRKISRIVLHATSGWGNQTTESIKSYWRNTLGWKQVGYHKLINLDGSIENLAPLDTVTNGVRGYNSDSIHICYKGGLISTSPKYVYGDTRSDKQKEGFEYAISDVFFELRELGVPDIDNITIVGHRDLSPDTNKSGFIEPPEYIKSCPTFNAIDEYGLKMCGERAIERLKKGRKYY